ncbi:MAG: D-alanyl-D-alanine carboxypeptidase family protein [Zymomonas mobilis subsp. pomaceae]|uniref:serine-type D-Ala-D-Ala carboxypeptidase n=1 Tax=Zymomonas mobilis subsp. pomaceae (strain ATCC 29192 / DSM 22645 / JCM 10191 / CCUG 17912 / NBRC 13757 / NCIMB 11200 / NRRL B-4491 / Barker I) TaxID=579138 RepID=F8EU23_ZYMMT|nr:D-alanyl-D-alanine carboxypeptidase family protein [Zymomonas mobilis]AEI37103.1 Serine-type D-Ala-D-Ala carboxypeptidase [Zymomonas mobilis subsp. pomaceae ATCC 29192]MDX5948474.1 D-alanyl-D-alanine carboxypeptidase family protein [Zymomonas mobilis subsp. pomaceae]GEB89461.1 D-alanyl-D-alanine carboxypeptidase [Zymomonas mobilis subsp. pomaceae]
MKPAFFISVSITAWLTTASLYAAAPPFETIAPIAYMKDLSSGAVLYSKDADRRMPPASMAKMMTVYIAFDLIKKGQLKLDQPITVQPETWKKWHGPAAGSTMFLSPNEQVSVANLLHGIVTLSGNDACVVLSEGIAGTEPAFVSLMNETAQRIGLTNSHFGTANGWPDGGVTYVTAHDLETLAEATIRDFPDLYRQFYGQREFTWGKTLGSGKDITQSNRDPLLGVIEGADGLKTGHTDEAGYGFTGSAEQKGRRLVMVMAGLPSGSARREQSIAFMNWGFRAWKSKPVVRKGVRVQTAEVQGGSASSVGLVAPRDLAVTLPITASDQIKVKVTYQGPIKAPIAEGQHIANLVVFTSDTPPQITPLVAEKAVASAGFFGRIKEGVRWLLGRM